jgi:hypothetical protein
MHGELLSRQDVIDLIESRYPSASKLTPEQTEVYNEVNEQLKYLCEQVSAMQAVSPCQCQSRDDAQVRTKLSNGSGESRP